MKLRQATDYLSSERAANRLLWLLAFIALPLAGLILTNKADPDLWMHLLAGRQMLETGGVPRFDSFSFLAAGRPWITHEWLFQLIAYIVYSALGTAGLMTAKAFICAGTLFFLYRQIRIYAHSQPARIFVFLAASSALVSLGFVCRPQIITFMLCALALYLFHRARTGGEREQKLFSLSPWLLVPWSWLHGGVTAGAGIFLIIAIGQTLAGRPPLRLLANTALALAATLLGPYGPRLWTRLYETLSFPALSRVIIEWQPFWASTVPVYRWYTVFFAAALIACFIADTERKKNVTVWLLAAAGLAAALHAVRHITLLAIFSAAPLAAGLERLCGSLKQRQPPSGRFFLPFNLALIALAAGLAAWTFYFTPVRLRIPIGAIVAREARPGWVTYPKGAVNFMRNRAVGGRLWSDANAGAYLAWHLYPACRIFMDTRVELLYSREEISDYLAAMAARADWPEILKKYRPELLLLPAGNPLARAAEAQKNWKPVYRDADYVLLAGDSPAFAALIKEYAANPKISPLPPLPWLFP